MFKFNGSVFCFASYSSCGPYEFNDIVSSFKFSQEALVLVIDVGPTMHGILPEIGKVCSMLIEKKVYPAPLSSQLKHSCKSLDNFVRAYSKICVESSSLCKQLIYSKADEVAVVLFGIEGILNTLFSLLITNALEYVLTKMKSLIL